MTIQLYFGEMVKRNPPVAPVQVDSLYYLLYNGFHTPQRLPRIFEPSTVGLGSIQSTLFKPHLVYGFQQL